MTRHARRSLPGPRMLAAVATAITVVAGCANAAPVPSVATSSTPAPTAAVTQAPTATPSATPAATPTATAAPATAAPLSTLADESNYRPCPNDGPTSCLDAGTYRLGSDVVATAVGTVVIADGWFEWDMGPGTEGLLIDRTDAKDGSGWGVLFSSVHLVSRDPCDSTAGTFPAGSTSSVDGVITAMRKWPGFQVGPARPVTLGGATGKQVAVTSTKTLATCPDPAIWQTPQGTDFNGYPEVGDRAKAYTAQFTLLDVAGSVLAIRTTDFPQTTATEIGQGIAADPKRHVTDQATLHAVLDSLQFGQGS
jgi:hypothetical protein